MSFELAAQVLEFDEVKRGPRGGSLTKVSGDPTWRREPFHPQIQENGELSLHRFNESFVDTTASARKNEQPWHRMAAYMLAGGRSNKEIADAAGVAEVTISHLRAQRWFQELCATLANGNGKDILGVIKSEALASVEKLVELRDGANSERVQLTAAITIVEHAHGKPVQKILSASVHQTLSPKEEVAELQRELATLRQQHAA